MKRKRIILPILAAFVLLAASVLFSTTKSSAQKLDPVVIECNKDWGTCWTLEYHPGLWGTNIGGYFYCKWTGSPLDNCTRTMVAIGNLPSMGSHDQRP